jgi:hypothetical protein
VEPAAINFAEHLYWNAPEGYKGTLVNDEDVTDDIAGNKIKILKAINVVQIPGCPKIILAQEGLPYANYWVGRYTDGKEDPDGKPDTGYLCIEPVENDPNKPFNSPENMLQPGDSRPATFTISLEKVAA